MIFRPFYTYETGCAAYLFGCGSLGKCAVVDPQDKDVGAGEQPRDVVSFSKKTNTRGHTELVRLGFERRSLDAVADQYEYSLGQRNRRLEEISMALLHVQSGDGQHNGAPRVSGELPSQAIVRAIAESFDGNRVMHHSDLVRGNMKTFPQL